MIHVNPADEPPGFDQKVRMPGLRAIAELVGEEPPRWLVSFVPGIRLASRPVERQGSAARGSSAERDIR